MNPKLKEMTNRNTKYKKMYKMSFITGKVSPEGYEIWTEIHMNQKLYDAYKNHMISREDLISKHGYQDVALECSECECTGCKDE